MDVLKNFCDGERQSVFQMMEGSKVSRVKILIFWYITSWYLIEILHTSSTLKNSKNELKILRWRAQIFGWHEGTVSGVLCENIFLADLLGSQYLCEILQTSLTFKNSENVVKSGCFQRFAMESTTFFSK